MTYFLLPDIDLWLSYKVAKLDCTVQADIKYWTVETHNLLKETHKKGTKIVNNFLLLLLEWLTVIQRIV